MGTHEDKRPPWARFRQWRRYRRELARLVRADRRAQQPITPKRLAQLKGQARRKARGSGE